MSTTETSIGEHDVVTLRNPVDGWPAGTKGAVISVFSTHRWVEVADEEGKCFDLVWAPTVELELVQKSPCADPTRVSS